MLTYSTESRNLNQSLNDMRAQIDSLESDLEYYKQNPKASEKAIFFKQQQIKIFTHILQSVTEFKDNTDLIMQQSQTEIAKRDDIIFKFEGICLLHGISNFKYYLNMQTQALIAFVKRAFTEKWRQTPTDLIQPETQQNEVTLTELIASIRGGKPYNEIFYPAAQLTAPAYSHTPTVPYTDLINKASEDLHGKEKN